VTALLELHNRDLVAIVAVVIWLAVIVVCWWLWQRPVPGETIRLRFPAGPVDWSKPTNWFAIDQPAGRVVAVPAPDPGSWRTPPYDWARRPGARVDLGLRREQLIGKRAPGPSWHP